MDGHGFDQLTKRLALLTTRRTGFRVLLAGAGVAGLLGLEADDVAAACAGPGKRCKNGRPCCSKICVRGRKNKSKKGKGRTKGRCDCSFPQEACNTANDCCFSTSTCGDNDCDPDNRCCEGAGAACIDPCDCCLGFTCLFGAGQELGQCVPCVALQEPCDTALDCCAFGSTCDNNGSGPQDVCCLEPGVECIDDFDCCGADRCSSRFENTCQTCPTLGELCNAITNNCCDKDALCRDNGCDESGDRCCFQSGGSCEDDCDCCEEFVCNLGTKTCQKTLDRQLTASEAVASASPMKGSPAERDRGNLSKRRSGKARHNRRRRR